MGQFDPTLSMSLAKWYEKVSYEKIPEHVVEKIKEFFLDSLGCTLGAFNEEPAKIAREVAAALGGPAEATIIGSGIKVAAANAALANGIQAHTLDFDDDHREGTQHPSVCIIPATLALAEKEGRSGKDFLASALCGYETMIRSGAAFLGKAYYSGWHPTGTCGVFGAAAAAAKLWGLSKKQTVYALGLALSLSSGTREYGREGTWAKRLHPGHAAQGGIIAAMLARKDFVGPSRPFEGTFGLFKVYSRDYDLDPERIIRGLGKEYDVATNSIKYHMGGRFGATGADALMEILQDKEIPPESIEEVAVHACDFAIQVHFGKDSTVRDMRYRPKSVEQAMFSLPFTLACILVYGKVGLDQYRQEVIEDQKILSMMDRVKGIVDPVAESKYPKHYMTTVTVKEKSGKSSQAIVEYPKGDPENPLTREELLDKFYSLSTKTVSLSVAKELADMVLNIENLPDIRRLTAFLSAE
jgi:2-methylcitrate dehydratase PrpD